MSTNRRLSRWEKRDGNHSQSRSEGCKERLLPGKRGVEHARVIEAEVKQGEMEVEGLETGRSAVEASNLNSNLKGSGM